MLFFNTSQGIFSFSRLLFLHFAKVEDCKAVFTEQKKVNLTGGNEMKRAKKLFALLLCMLLCVGLMPTMAFATGGSVISNLTATRDSETTATITFDSTQAGSVAIVFKNGNGSFELYIGNKDGVTVGTNVITYEQLTGSDAKEIAVYFGTDDSDFYALYSSPNPLDEPGAVKGTVPVVHTCVGQGDWQYDPDNHWKLCGVCGNRVDEVAHSGGTATCTTPAVCEVCQHAYGSVNSGNHSGKIVWTQTETTHSSAYECCGVPVVAEEAHDWQNGVCSECGYECQHSGGEATCTAPAICELCGQSYGSVDPDNHTGKVVWTQAETGHSSAYDCCDTAVVTNQPHTYEWVTDKEATATEAGSKHEKCTVCGYAKASVEIPATGTTETPSATDDTTDSTTTPQTGDTNGPWIWGALMLVSGAALTGVIIHSRKRKVS